MAMFCNSSIFQQAPANAILRMAGRFDAASLTTPSPVLIATDGGRLNVVLEGGVTVSQFANQFVEVVGAKLDQGSIQASSVLAIGGENVDAQLWEDFIRLMHAPQLAHLFGHKIPGGVPQPQVT